MKTTIDGAGRVVVPKALRDELGLQAGVELEASVRDGHLELEPVSPDVRMVRRRGVLVAESTGPRPVLTADAVRQAQERVRR